jgi:hypothetical protein
MKKRPDDYRWCETPILEQRARLRGARKTAARHRLDQAFKPKATAKRRK